MARTPNLIDPLRDSADFGHQPWPTNIVNITLIGVQFLDILKRKYIQSFFLLLTNTIFLVMFYKIMGVQAADDCRYRAVHNCTSVLL